MDWQQQYQVAEVSASIADRAMSLVENHELRGYDAVHLAAAVALQEIRQAIESATLVFVSADEEQLQAAKTEGLEIENPNKHP